MKTSRIFLALLWHQHQPCYSDLSQPGARIYFSVPWVRLHALRDYYSMAALVADFPAIHLTLSLTPILLRQIEDYAERDATDAALELTRTPTRHLTSNQREELQRTFFDADWHNEVYPHARYKELFDRCGSGGKLNDRDVTDLRMWFNLAWFAPEFQTGEVRLPDATSASVKRFVEKSGDFSEEDIAAMIAEQFKIIRNVVSIHRRLQDAGQIEVATTPFYHPILPLLHDSDLAILDRTGCGLPPRFAHPEDAEVQTRDAAEYYTHLFGRRPSGMWPAEGAVGESVIEHFKNQDVRWIASDAGVLRRSGEWGYEVHRPEVLGKAWRAGSDEPDGCVSIFFRDADLSDAIGFRYAHVEPGQAVDDFVSLLKHRYGTAGQEDRIVTVILDGENAWGSYRQAGRPFFAELYRRIGADPEIFTVTFDEWLRGSPERKVAKHPIEQQERVCKLAHASWIDERGSMSGNDLGTWIGEPEENTAWELLRMTRSALKRRGTPSDYPGAHQAIYAAEGSDWFWWMGDDQDCDADPLFDDLFRQHLRAAYLLGGLEPPESLDRPILPHIVTWSFQSRNSHLFLGDLFRFRAGCPGILTWRTSGSATMQEIALRQSGGVMAGLNIHSATLGPFDASAGSIEFRFQCDFTPVCHCLPGDLCRDGQFYRVLIKGSPPDRRLEQCRDRSDEGASVPTA